MKESTLLKKLTDEGWTRTQFREIDSGDVLPGGAKLEHWMISGIKTEGDVTVRKNFLLYKDGEGNYTWQESDPFPVPKETPQFQLDLVAYLTDKLVAVTSLQANAEEEKAVVKAVIDVDGALIEKRILVSRGDDGKLKHTIIEV